MVGKIEERYDLAKKVYQVGRHSLEIWQLEDFEKAVSRLIDEVADEICTDLWAILAISVVFFLPVEL